MTKEDVFGALVGEYEAWFVSHAFAYASELRAVRKLLPSGKTLEVGVGTGRFSAPAGVPFGMDPSLPMLRLAQRRKTKVAAAAGEFLPVVSGALDGVLFVTTLCFIKDPEAALVEARRVLRPGGILVCACVDARSPLAKRYAERKDQSAFYGEARFLGAGETQALLEKTGFVIRKVLQTLFGDVESMREPEDPRAGFGEGAFVAIQAAKTV